MSAAALFAARTRPLAGRWRPPVSRSLMALGLVLAGALAIRVAALDRSLWIDETISLLQVDRSLAGILQTQVNGVHPPLFHLLLHGWISLLGDAPTVLRGYSVAWSLVAVVAIWGWSREAFPSRSPLPAAVFAAMAPFAVWYGTEIRMYAQLLALVALSGWTTWRMLDRRLTPGRLAAVAACLVAVVYTHYFATLYVVALGVVALGLLISGRIGRKQPLALLGACTLSAVLLAPWVAFVAVSREARPLTTVFEDPDVFTALIAGIEMLTGFRSFALLGLLAAGWPLLCFAAIALMPAIGSMRWRQAGLIVLFVLPPLLLAAVSLLAPRSAFDSRYLTVCAAPLYVLAGGAWGSVPGARLRVLLGTLLVTGAALLAVWQSHDPSNPRLFELREAVGAVNALARPGDAVMLVPQVNELEGREPVLAHYRPRPGLQVVDTSPGGRAGTVAPAQMWRRLGPERARRVFVVYGFDALVYSVRDARVLTGSGLAQAYDRYLTERSAHVARLVYANVNVRAYTLEGPPR